MGISAEGRAHEQKLTIFNAVFYSLISGNVSANFLANPYNSNKRWNGLSHG